MAEQKQVPLYKQTRQPRKAAKVDIQDMLYNARQWQYQRTAADDSMLLRFANGELNYDKFKEYIDTRKRRAVGAGERAAMSETQSKALNIYRTNARNDLIRRWNAREISINTFKNAMQNLGAKYDPKSETAIGINQDIFDAIEANRADVQDNWRVRYETGNMPAKEYRKNLLGMQKKYEPKTAQFNAILEEIRTVDNWVKAESIKQKVEAGKISIDKGQELYLNLANQMAEGSQDRLDLLNIVSNLGKQEYDKAINRETVLRNAEIADSQARQTILQSQYLTDQITSEQYNLGIQEEAALQTRLGQPLPEYDATQWGAGKTGPQFKSERVQRIAGAMVGDKIHDPSQLTGMKEEDIIRTDEGIYTRPDYSTPKVEVKETTTETVKPSVTPTAGPGAPTQTKITSPDYLKYYTEDEIDRQGQDIYLKRDVPIRWK